MFSDFKNIANTYIYSKLTPLAAISLMLVWLLTGGSGHVDAQSSDAVLTKAQLTLFHDHWICPEEVEIQKVLHRLPEAEKNHRLHSDRFYQTIKQTHDLIKRLNKLRQQNNQIDQQLINAQNNILLAEKLTVQKKSLVKKRAALEKLFRKENDIKNDASKLSNRSKKYISSRTQVALLLIRYQKSLDAIEKKYLNLNGDPSISSAIYSIDRSKRLGPIKKYQPITDFRIYQQIFSAKQPIYRRSNAWQVDLFINEEVPVTFSYSGRAPLTLLPSQVIQSTGIDIPEDAPVVVLQRKSQNITARKVLIPQLRIGSQLLTNVEAYALPPEAEDIGALLSPKSLVGYQIEIQPISAQLTIQKK